jgi:nicotinamidase-related amidase
MIKTSRKKNLLLIIDMQHDFAANGGSLYVPGAEEDVLRVAEVIVKHDKAIDHIIFTQDTHHVLDISHPGFWRNEKGESPEPFTEIKSMQVAKGEWVPIEDTGYVLNYLENLEAKGEFPHVIWPEHCLIGSVGHALVPPLVEKVADWARKGRKYEVVQKGINPMTEHFGALSANVPIDDAPETQLNMVLVDQLHQFENIIIAGEAKSHCVANTLKQILELEKYSFNLTVLEDCMSPVPGFEKIADPIYQKGRDAGVQFIKSKDLILT